jgi:hypothetical protein
MSINAKSQNLKNMSPLLAIPKKSNFSLEGKKSIKSEAKEIVNIEEKGVYKGPVNMGNMPHGIGKFTFKDGSVFIGQFDNGVLEGLGRLENIEEKMSYQGEWKNWQKFGKGKEEFWQTGEIYDGNWVNGERTGYGKFVKFTL